MKKSLKCAAFALVLAAVTLGTGRAWGHESTDIESAARSGPAEDVGLLHEKDITVQTEVQCGIFGECHVDSRVNARIKVYVNGVYRGTIPPWGDIYPFVADLGATPTYLYAVTECGTYYWQRTLGCEYDTFHWILRP